MTILESTKIHNDKNGIVALEYDFIALRDPSNTTLSLFIVSFFLGLFAFILCHVDQLETAMYTS